MGKKTKIKDKDKLNFWTREAMIAMWGLVKTNGMALGSVCTPPQSFKVMNNSMQIVFTITITTGIVTIKIIISVLSQLHYHSHRTRRKDGRGVGDMSSRSLELCCNCFSASLLSLLSSQLHYHSHRTRRKGGRGVAPMRALLVAPVTPSPRCCPGIVHWAIRVL